MRVDDDSSSMKNIWFLQVSGFYRFLLMLCLNRFILLPDLATNAVITIIMQTWSIFLPLVVHYSQIE